MMPLSDIFTEMWKFLDYNRKKTLPENRIELNITC